MKTLFLSIDIQAYLDKNNLGIWNIDITYIFSTSVKVDTINFCCY